MVYWMEDESWFIFDENGIAHPTDKAPKRAIKSLELWRAQKPKTSK